MIKLINNEFKKIGLFKILISFIIFYLIIYIIYKNSSDFVNTMFSLIPFVGIMCCMFYGGILSNEIENGTIRFYLTKPIKRWKIYLSKLLSIYLYLFIMINFIVCLYYYFNNGISKSIIIEFYKYSIPLFMYGSLLLFLSSIFRSTSICVVLTIFIIVFGLFLSQIILELDFKYIEYSFIMYSDFSMFKDANNISFMNNTYSIHLSLNRGIFIDLMYILLFYFLGNFIFTSKDIKN